MYGKVQSNHPKMRPVESPGLWQKPELEARIDDNANHYKLRYAIQLLSTLLERRLATLPVTIGPRDSETLDLRAEDKPSGLRRRN